MSCSIIGSPVSKTGKLRVIISLHPGSMITGYGAKEKRTFTTQTMIPLQKLREYVQ
ncbi:MAG: hypothetical protein ABIN67_24045 [Ferruginibacter sp.]